MIFIGNGYLMQTYQNVSHRQLISHLFRRAGFGVSDREIEKYLEKSYEDVVDELIGTGNFIDFEDDGETLCSLGC